jgi:predicted glycosyltransferase involved in capsule biosynthesis
MEDYYSYHNKSGEEYEREKNACRNLYNESLKQQFEEAKNMLFECMDTLDKFLVRMCISVETFTDYIECSTYDKNFLREVVILKTKEDLLRDYYSSVL